MAAVNFSTLMPRPGAKPGFNLDGDYSSGFPTGIPMPSYPYQDKGNTDAVQIRQKWEQAIASYAPPNLLAPMPGQPTLFPFGDVNFSDGRAGVTLFERRYGNIPASWSYHESFHYPFQTLSTASTNDNGGVSYTATLGSQSEEVDSTVTHDYFLLPDIGRFPLLNPPKVVEATTNDFRVMGTGDLYVFNSCVCSHDAYILAEPDVYGNYEGAIMFRRRRQIVGPTPAFWGNELNLAGVGSAGGSSTIGSGNEPVPVGGSSAVPGFTVSPVIATAGASLAVTFTGTATNWTAATTFSATGGTLTITSVNVATQVATGTFVAPASNGPVSFTDSYALLGTDNLLVRPAVPVGTFSVVPPRAAVGAPQNLTFTGSGTAWTAATTFTVTAGTLSNLQINPALQIATARFTPAAAAESVAFVDSVGGVGANTIGVLAASAANTFAVAPAALAVNQTATLTFTGIGTAWRGDTLFTPAAADGGDAGSTDQPSTVVDVVNQIATMTYTAPAQPKAIGFAAGPLGALGTSSNPITVS